MNHGTCLWMCFMLAAAPITAQYATPEAPTPQGVSNILGAGARALGMGGAFTAIADDATAASWNPAGLAQISKPEITIVFDSFSASQETDWIYDRDYDAGLSYEGTPYSADGRMEYSQVGFAGFSFPVISSARTWTLQVSYRRLSTFPSFTQGWYEEWILRDENEGGTVLLDEFVSKEIATDTGGGIYDFAFSVAVDLFPNLKAGITANYLDADVSHRTEFIAQESYYDVPTGDVFQYDEVRRDSFRYAFSGITLDYGLLWTPLEHFALGAVYHSSFTADLDYWAATELRATQGGLNLPRLSMAGTSRMRWPDGWAVGLAVRPNTAVTLAVDYSVTAWSRAVVDEVRTAEYGFLDEVGEWTPEIVTWTDAPFPYLTAGRQEDSSSLRAGAEYVWISPGGLAVPVRAGWSREKQIVSFWRAGGLPVVHSIALGTGLTYGNVQLDLAWSHSRCTDSGEALRQGEGYSDDLLGEQKTTTNRVMFSMMYRFE